MADLLSLLFGIFLIGSLLMAPIIAVVWSIAVCRRKASLRELFALLAFWCFFAALVGIAIRDAQFRHEMATWGEPEK
jgi:hypothetical protein